MTEDFWEIDLTDLSKLETAALVVAIVYASMLRVQGDAEAASQKLLDSTGTTLESLTERLSAELNRRVPVHPTVG